MLWIKTFILPSCYCSEVAPLNVGRFYPPASPSEINCSLKGQSVVLHFRWVVKPKQ
jgi:hypothetical protein